MQDYVMTNYESDGLLDTVTKKFIAYPMLNM